MEGEGGRLPKKVTAIGILMVISGILMILTVLSSVVVFLILGTIFLAFFGLGLLFYILMIPYLLILAGGIIDLMFGIRTLMGRAPNSLPIWSPVIEIIFGIYLISSIVGIFILIIGIINLILLLQDDTRMYYYKRADWD